MTAKKKAPRGPRRAVAKTARRAKTIDLTSAKSPRGGAVVAAGARVMTVKGATVNIN